MGGALAQDVTSGPIACPKGRGGEIDQGGDAQPGDQGQAARTGELDLDPAHETFLREVNEHTGKWDLEKPCTIKPGLKGREWWWPARISITATRLTPRQQNGRAFYVQMGHKGAVRCSREAGQVIEIMVGVAGFEPATPASRTL
jgi:hypothetical protein